MYPDLYDPNNITADEYSTPTNTVLDNHHAVAATLHSYIAGEKNRISSTTWHN